MANSDYMDFISSTPDVRSELHWNLGIRVTDWCLNPEVSLVFCFLSPSVATNKNPCETCWVLCSLFGLRYSNISWHVATACSNRCQTKLYIYNEMFLSCLVSKYLDSGRLLTFSLENEKEFFVLPAKSIAIGGKETPWGEVSATQSGAYFHSDVIMLSCSVVIAWHN